MKKQAKVLNTVLELATLAKAQGFTVYLSADKKHGFYTNGQYCVSFETPLHTGQISLSSNHKPNKLYGTGFTLNENMAVRFRDYNPIYDNTNLNFYLQKNKNSKVQPVNEQQYLAQYGKCCGYTKF